MNHKLKKVYYEALYLGKRIKIIDMSGEPHYAGKTGVVNHIDDAAQLWGTWGGLAVIPGADSFEVLD